MSETNTAAARRLDWRLAAGILASLAVAALIVFNVLNYFKKHAPETYDQVLSDYYYSIAKGNTNGLNQITAPGFTDETAMLKVTPGKYMVFRYNYEELPAQATNSNSVNAFSKALFSVSTTEEKDRVSYLNEAYFTFEGGQAKIRMIRKLYVGKNITR